MNSQDIINEIDPNILQCDYCRKYKERGDVVLVARRSAMSIQKKLLCRECRNMNKHSSYSLSLRWMHRHNLTLNDCKLAVLRDCYWIHK